MSLYLWLKDRTEDDLDLLDALGGENRISTDRQSAGKYICIYDFQNNSNSDYVILDREELQMPDQ